jgi:hypothetical protein
MPEGRNAVQEISLSLPAANVRIDSLYPDPSQPGLLIWRDNAEFAVHGSVVSIDEEARGQRFLFFAGIAASLATGLAP